MKTSQYWIKQLNLEPHPEGGYFRRIYQSNQMLTTKTGDRHSATAIHYLLENGDYSAWHRIQQDEMWFHHQGGALIIRCIDSQGQLEKRVLGPEHDISTCIPANTWFCSELFSPHDDYCLVSCVVSPGFDFADFEMGNQEELVNLYPQHRDIICRLCRA